MRSDGTKKSPVRMLVYLLLLAAVVALGYFTDIVDFTELKAVFSLKLTALLKLAVMVLLVLLVSNLVIFILHGIKPRTHRGGSVLSLLSSLVKYVAGIIIVCQSLSLLGVNVGTIIASVGVLALVVGFSAESLIADVVIGAFMLLENQYNVGDIVEVNGFRGVVTKSAFETRDGFTYGDTVIRGTGEYEGHTLHVWYQNENIIAWLDGEPWITAPDLICLFNEDEGLPQLNPYGDAGTRESVICLPAPADWTTPRGLELFSPRFFGFDVDYMPFFR